MYKTEAIITKVENFKENHLSISVYSSEYGQKSLVVFGGKSKKKNSLYIKGSLNNIEFDNNNVCLSSTSINKFKWFLFSKYELKTIDYFCFLINKLLFLTDQNSNVISYYLLLISKYELIYEHLKDNKNQQLVFFDFMSRIVNRVLINLNINLPFSRDEITRKI